MGTPPLDGVSDFAMWSVILGFITVPVTAIINRARWDGDVKMAVFFAFCCISAAGNAYVNRELDFENWVRSLLVVLSSGVGLYFAAKPAFQKLEARTG